ncbi:hypothetical protein [Roseateles sp.]|uniref:hypothetical protein n=1 Tax=Roseateles sp. TaxID=1971397 RepID=UPI0039ED136F
MPAIALLIATSARAAVSLQLDVGSHVRAKAGASRVPPDRQATFDVTLGENYLMVESTGETIVYDFASRKRSVIDKRTKTRVDYSLYDTVGFRVYEFRNRSVLGGALSASKVDDSAMAQVDNEHNLAVQDKPSSPLRVTTEGTDEVFYAGPKVMFRQGVRLMPASTTEARMFAQLIRYTFGGHPQILSALAQANSIPKNLSLVTYDVGGTTTHTVTVRSVSSNNGRTIDASALPIRPASGSDNPVDQALDRAVAFTPHDLSNARQRSKDELDTALREGRGLDAFLGIVEWTLMTGEAPAPLNADQQKLVKANDAVRRLTVALSAKSKDDLSKAVVDIADVAKSATTKAYVLRIFEANNRAMLGERGAAQKLFLEVLKSNPFIAGVYKDLGDNMFVDFDMPRAWRCWDIGRKIAPGFANFRSINQMESSLAAQHPEFF